MFTPLMAGDWCLHLAHYVDFEKLTVSVALTGLCPQSYTRRDELDTRVMPDGAMYRAGETVNGEQAANVINT